MFLLFQRMINIRQMSTMHTFNQIRQTLKRIVLEIILYYLKDK